MVELPQRRLDNIFRTVVFYRILPNHTIAINESYLPYMYASINLTSLKEQISFI